MDYDSVIDFIKNECGIDVEEYAGPVSFLLRNGFRKLTDDEMASLSGLFQYAPQMLAQKITDKHMQQTIKMATDGSFRLIIDAGRHLAKLRNNPNRFSSNTFDANNKNMRPAIWEANDVVLSSFHVEQIIANAFNAASFITGQYFQSQISSTMKALNRDVRGVKGFLESERKGTFQSYVNWLQSHAEHLKHIQIDDDRRKNAAQDVGHMVRFFDDTLSSSVEHILSLLDNAKNNYSAEDVSRVFNEIANNLYLYHQALSMYCNSVNLSICLNKIVNPEEIRIYCADMRQRIIDYQRFKTDCIKRLNKYLSEVDVLNRRSGWKSFLSGLKGLGRAGLDLAAFGGWGVLLATLDGKDAVSTSNKKYDAELIKQKNKLIDEMNKALEPCHDVTNANEAVSSLQYYLRAINRLEFVKTGDAIYTNMPSPTH